MAGNEDALRALLQRFADAFTGGDGAAAAACWEVPALVVSQEGTRAVNALSEVAAFFGGAQAQYLQQGVSGTRPQVQRIDWHTDQLASVTVRWPYLDAQGHDLGRSERSVYLMRVHDGAPHICAVVMLGAQ